MSGNGRDRGPAPDSAGRTQFGRPEGMCRSARGGSGHRRRAV